MYLLSTQSLLDFLCAVPAVMDFLAGLPRNSVHVSVVSLGLVEEYVRATPADEGRDDLDRRFRTVLAATRASGGVENFTEASARAWASLAAFDFEVLESGSVRPMNDVERMVVATALERRLILVEEPQPYHDSIPELRVVDPHA